MRKWAIAVVLYVFLLGIFIYAYIEDDRPISTAELISRFAVAIPAILLIRSGMIVGILIGKFLRSTAEEKTAQNIYWIRSAKREGLWYGGSVSLLLLLYRWTPFAGQPEILFMFVIAIPLGCLVIFALYSWQKSRGETAI
ncbi:MAG TPA: hypothetical protein VFI62_15135 [Burkholderiales bacterium]|nr:hypothetical protein [Burkholderiales bacterium]